MSGESLAQFLESVSLSMPALVLLLGACIGHGFLMIIALNVLYAWPLPHEVLKYTRKIDLLIIFGAPVLFAWALDILDTQRLAWDPGVIRAWLSPYIVACWMVGFIVAPMAEILYLLRRQAPQLVHEHGEIVDFEEQLGYTPLGGGKDAALCRIPGNRVFQVEFTDKVLSLPQLPAAWDGLSILHLTDLHLCGTPDRIFFQTVMERCLQAGVPDLIALTGDVVDSDWHHRWIVPVLGRLRCHLAAYAILGNHDSWRNVTQIRRRLRRIGMRVLGNSWELLNVRGVPLAVIGHEGPWFRPAPDLSACPDGIFRLCLSHTPDNIAWARRHKIDLVLAGHVHGGQIRLPVLGSVFVPSRFSRQYDCGTFYRAPTVMHVGRGLSGQHPLRFFCYPEVTRITLRRHA
jgi:predicted MPP superfamily phosphohydrolase